MASDILTSFQHLLRTKAVQNKQKTTDMLTGDFLAEFKQATEKLWSERSIDPTIYGFQFQRGTRWLPGLSEKTITEYQAALKVSFPHDLRTFLRAMNGTDLPTLNLYGSSGVPPRESVGVYSYPRDMKAIQERIANVRSWRAELSVTLADQGVDLSTDANLVPIYVHRYLVCTSNPSSSVVLSVQDGADAIVYGNSLREYLEKEFLG